MERLRQILIDEKIPFEKDQPLSRHSSFRIGGPAALGVFPQTREALLTVLRAVRDQNIPHLVIGNASNVVFSDRGFDGAVIFTGGWKEIDLKGNIMRVSAGASLLSVAVAARDASLSGAEFAYGIPGTLGGAVFMNAGAFGGEMAGICLSSEYFDGESGEIGVLEGTAQEFDSRTSIYEKHPHYTILGAALGFERDEKEAICARMEDYLARRKSTQPLEYPSAGSVFKRPAGHYAGKLIEDCGLKGTAVGGAQVSEKHAGFIINRTGATAEDVRRLVELIRERVLKTYGVELECEIRFL